MVKISSQQVERPLAGGRKYISTLVFTILLVCAWLVGFFDVKTANASSLRLGGDPRTADAKETKSNSKSVSDASVSSSSADPGHVPSADRIDKDDSETASSPNSNVTMTASCLDPNGPQPYILLARGRSGTGSTLQVLGTLTGMHIPGDHEITGSSPNQARKRFRRIGPNDAGNWVLDYLCEQQRKYPEAGLVAFKWKPYGEAMFYPAAIAGLQRIAKSRDPQIKVVRLRRNLLDNYISDAKHERANQENAKIPAHCPSTNKNCVNQHKRAGTNLTLSVPDLLSFLETETDQEDTVDQLLLNMTVPHVHVSYEKLYHDDQAEEWMKVFRFLGVGPATGLTRKQVDDIAHAPTSHPHHRRSIYNYDEVEKGLKGTRFEGLLHP